MTTLNFNCSAFVGGDDYTNDLLVTLQTPIQPGVNAAPAPVFFRVDNVTGCAATDPVSVFEPKFHDIVYVWDFDDAANANPDVVSSMSIPTEWKNINKAYGARVAHVFNDPGTYNVTVTAYEPATRRKGTATVSVTIGDPKVVFPTTRTIIYNPGNLINPATYGYASANNVTGTWANVITARNAIGAATTAQILIAPNVTIENTTLADSPSWRNIRIGALDPAQPKPIIRRNSIESANSAFLIKDFNTTTNIERVVFGLRFEGDWDSPSESGRVYRPFGTTGVGAGITYLAMQHRCEFDGWEVVNFATGDATSYTLYGVHSELDVTNWQDYGLHGCQIGNTSTATIGCNVHQHPDACSTATKDLAMYNQHGPIRDFGSENFYMAVCDTFTRNGWASGGTYTVDNLAFPAHQPCLRINTRGRSGCRANIERIAAEGYIELQEQDTTNIDVPGNYVFDKILNVVNGSAIQESVNIRYGGVTFRNALSVAPNVPGFRATSFFRKFYNLDNTKGSANNDQPIRFYNCTAVDLRNNTNANNQTIDFVGPGYSFTQVTIQNNVFHQPNRSPSIIPDGPIDVTTNSGYVTRHRGPRAGFLWESGTLATSVAPNGYFTLSYADVKTTRHQQNGNNGGTDNGFATDQAYWQANTGGTNHKLRLSGISGRSLHDQYNEIEVTYEPTEIRVYNRTASTWTAGWTWTLKLDRRFYLPEWNPTYDYRNLLIPLARPQAGSAAIDSGDTGLKAYDDFLGNVRPATGNERGALLTV